MIAPNQTENRDELDRRQFLRLTAIATGALILPGCAKAADTSPAASAGGAEMVKFPEKTDLILLTDRPPQLETPIKYFAQDLTPNEAFFVRWHLGTIPTSVDTATFRLTIAGHVEDPLSLSLDDLKKNYDPVSVVAVAQCSGNSRSLYQPRVMGGQWGHGAVGNAKWTGVRLKDLLAKAKPKPGALEVSFNGLDAPPMATVPDFIKTLPVARANDPEVIVAYAMNDKPLPMLNGFPLRLVVPGWYATYWVKSLNEINVLDQPFKGFWMAKAYRVPNNPDCQESPKDLAKDTVPITTMTVRSLFVKPEPGEKLKAGEPYEVDGVAFDGGKTIAKVEVSTDAGKTWAATKLGQDLGKYSWRRWKHQWTPAAGQHKLMVRATNAAGETQTTAQWNRSGYARNVIESVEVTAG